MLRPGLKIALVVLLAQLCSSCRPYRTSLERHIKEIHSLSDTHPDSAFNEIMQINRHELSGKRLKAQFGLTCSKILDKNYIDICSDSIIAPALDYYSSRGTGQEKAETYYYAARVEENAGNYEESLFLLRKAEQYFRDDILGLGDEVAEAGVGNGIGTAFLYGDGDLLADLGEHRGSLGVGFLLLVHDILPFAMSGHEMNPFLGLCPKPRLKTS